MCRDQYPYYSHLLHLERYIQPKYSARCLLHNLYWKTQLQWNDIIVIGIWERKMRTKKRYASASLSPLSFSTLICDSLPPSFSTIRLRSCLRESKCFWLKSFSSNIPTKLSTNGRISERTFFSFLSLSFVLIINIQYEFATRNRKIYFSILN